MATAGGPLAALLGGGGAGQQPAAQPDQAAGQDQNVGQQIQQLQIQAMMIARSNPALAQAMRQIIQLSQAAMQTAVQGGGAGGASSAGPAPASY